MTKTSFTDRLSSGVLIGDGAMGTMLYVHGAFLNTCFDELNLSRPDLVKQIHSEYIAAGCDFVETNTFGANAFKLARYGLADQVERINAAAVKIAREAADNKDVLVAGAVGPSGLNNPTPNEEMTKALHDAFSQQVNALAHWGVDFLLLETFSAPAELLVAIDAAAKTGLPVLAQMTCTEQFETFFGTPIESAIAQIAQHPAVTTVGLNCSLGPSDMLEALKRLRKVTDKPLAIQPNAGLPRRVEGRTLYMSTPEYMAEYAKRFFEHGARIIGGCCGTTPEHIRQIARAVKPLARAMAQADRAVRISVSKEAPAGMPPVPLKDKSTLGAKLAGRKPVACIELTPPRGVDTDKLIEAARLCAVHNIDAINIPDGPRASARLSPLVTAVKLQQAAGIETILHICCRDKNLIGLQSDLLGIQAMGLRNVLLITGDPPKLGEYPDATGVFDLDSVALTKVVSGLNRGLDIAHNQLPQQLSLTIGVGANPVASELQREIDRFRQKTAAGAEYVITQPVFDIETFLAFQSQVANCGLPFIAGIWPFTSYKNAEFMANEVPGVTVPAALLARMAKATTRQDGQKIGIEIAREMIAALAPHVAGFAVSAPFGNTKLALSALGRISVSEI
ncbi:MAG: bifunctional homocysteine S-methyltransferase/methylenetetrahydrofolate reductase [Planctomycetaceae bacterium]|nr:bifunctional homocysteine S-methyltransferase/methylenetetrahydrofolate reductase [Planctomycetaceae bacterium]